MAVASVAYDAATEVLVPESEDDAIAAFGDGAEVVVVGGGTIVLPDLTYRRRALGEGAAVGERRVWPGSRREGSRVTVGAMTPVQDLVEMPAPLGPCAANVADLESAPRARSAATSARGEGIRGDARRPPKRVSRPSARPRGLRRAARSPRSRSRSSSPKRRERLLLSVSFDEPAAGASRASTGRTRTTTRLSRCRERRGSDGTLRLAATGTGSWGVRLPSAEAAAGDPLRQARQRSGDVSPHDERSRPRGTGRRCCRCSCAASSTS